MALPKRSKLITSNTKIETNNDRVEDNSKFQNQQRSNLLPIAALLILEFGVIFHSVIIGLNLGVAGDEFATLYPDRVEDNSKFQNQQRSNLLPNRALDVHLPSLRLNLHQSFEGLGIGARMSSIPFKKGSWLPWALCAAYGPRPKATNSPS
jgi:zinc transporter 1/2/3